MFTKDDFISYFDELSDIYRDSITIYTDLINDLQDRSMKNKLLAASSENMDAFRIIKEEKKKFS